MLSRRVAEEQHTGQATLMQTQQTLISAMEDNRVVTNVALLDDANPVNSSTTVHSEESADSVGHFDQCTSSPLSKDAATMIYSKYLLEIQSRITGLREESRKHQERRDQRRIDYTLESAQQAEKQYRSDTESEVDKKMKLASLNLQRSTLKIADRDWASKRTHSITSAYEAAIKSRLRNDFIVWGMLLVLTSLTFTIAASGCTIRKNAVNALSELCYLLSQESCAGNLGDNASQESQLQSQSTVYTKGGLSVLHRSSVAFYDTLVVPMSWAASQLLASLGVDLKNLVLSYFPSDTFACSVRLCMRLVVPYLGHRVINLAGVGREGRAHWFSLWGPTSLSPTLSMPSYLLWITL